ncbi:hypothetical protein NNC19_22695 [Clostridium sp. SHJSY1]|uniref:hypothetical protein n=1 Tax=Clostridium sp. SHJSY1 TaxID=2942483 RepID=UPI0028749E05|nr:hypothetical protein [Clostridium sp. SHJSY1]MDS0528502.1 hypothetical protein [Clostridium sp. SHJSY1]
MNYMKKELYFSIGFFMLGIVFLISSFLFYSNYESSPLSSIGTTFTLVGLMMIIINWRIIKNPKRCKEVETMKTEERTVFIREKTNSKVYSIFIYVEAAAMLVAAVLGYKDVIMFFAVIMGSKLVIWFIVANKIAKNN